MASTVPVLIHFSKKDVVKIDKLVKDGFYASRTEAVRDAVRTKIEELTKEDKVIKKVTEDEVEKALREYIEENPHDRLRKIGV